MPDWTALVAFFDAHDWAITAGVILGLALIGYANRICKFLYDFTRNYFIVREREAECKKYRDEREAMVERLEKLAKEIENANAVTIFRTWLVLMHDPAPRAPICPNCHANGKTIRMRQCTTDIEGKVRNWFQCSEDHRNGSFVIPPEEADALFEFLGSKGCYNPNTPKSSKTPPLRLSSHIRLRDRLL